MTNQTPDLTPLSTAGPAVTAPAPSRPARIAALHAAGVFLADNTALPMPERVQMVAYDLSEAEIHSIAHAHGAQIHHSSAHTWVQVHVALETLHGIEIDYIAHQRKDA